MIDFWKDTNNGLPQRAIHITVKTDSITVMKKLLVEGFDEVYDAAKMTHRTFFLISSNKIIVYRIVLGYQVYETLCFAGVSK